MNNVIKEIEEIKYVTLIGVKEVLNVKDMCFLTGWKEKQIYKLIQSRDIPHYRNGKTVFFNKKEINEWLQSNRVSTINELREIAKHR